MVASLSEHYWLVASVGFLAQAFFGARTFIQWFRSEKEHKLVSPTIFWILSLVGSAVMFLYGLLRDDFSIILGQVLMYYIYIWNLKMKGPLGENGRKMRISLMILPVAVVLMMAFSGIDYAALLFSSDDVPPALLLFGSAGQLLFALRFILQWYVSRKAGESIMPVPFWWMSLIAAGLVLVYGIIRLDIVLIVSQISGMIIYARNIWIGNTATEEEVAPLEDVGSGE